MKIAGAALAAMITVALWAAPAHAAKPTGTMTRYEWTGVGFHMGLAKVERRCDCTGVSFGHGGWPGTTGHRQKLMQFDGPGGFHGMIQFGQWGNGTWHAHHEKQWWNSGNIPVDQVIWTIVRPSGL